MPKCSVEEYQKLGRTMESPQGEASICREPLDLVGQWRDLGRVFLSTRKLRRNRAIGFGSMKVVDLMYLNFTISKFGKWRGL
jgi:hypothetical protein